jgi:ribosomal protein S24E
MGAFAPKQTKIYHLYYIILLQRRFLYIIIYHRNPPPKKKEKIREDIGTYPENFSNV